MKQEIAVNKTFTLNEFVFVARTFVVIEEDRVRNVHQGQENYQKVLVEIIDRLERLEKWFEERRVQYLLDLAIEFSLIEQGQPQTATTQQSQGPGQEQLAVAPKSQADRMKESLEDARSVVDLKVDFLMGYALLVKMAAFNKF